MSQFYVGGSGGGGGPTVTITGNDQVNKDGFGTNVTGSSPNFQVNSYGPYKWIVNPVAGLGTHQTINAAVAASVGGDSIFITPGTYTENIVAPHSIYLIGADVFQNNQVQPGVVIFGKISNSTSDAQVSVENIRLATNGDYALELTGAGASYMFIRGCYLQGFNFSLTNSSNSSPSSQLILDSCYADLLNTGINVFNHSSNNVLKITNSFFANSANSALASTSSGQLLLDDVTFGGQITPGHAINITSGSANFNNCFMQDSTIGLSLSGGTTIAEGCTLPKITLTSSAQLRCIASNTLPIALSGTSGAVITNSTIVAGISNGITVNIGTIAVVTNSSINSSNTAITGSGTVQYSNISFIGSSSLINATTQTPLVSSNDAVKIKIPGAYPYTAVPQDAVILVDTSAARTINLNASPATGQKYRIKDDVGSAGTNTITIVPAAGTIDGAANALINVAWGSLDIAYTGTAWRIL